jgi:putative membrane protein insertion efficiency factor
MGTDAEERNGRAVRLAFRLYKSLLSPVLHAISPSRCLYLPTCSEYATIAVSRFGWVRGSWLALGRLARCHPWGKGGLDPVPERASPALPRAARPDFSGDVQTGASQSSADQTGADKKAADQTGADHLP